MEKEGWTWGEVTDARVQAAGPQAKGGSLTLLDNGWPHSKAGGVRSPGFLELSPETEVEILPPWLSACVTVGGGEDEPSGSIPLPPASRQ